MGRVYLSSTSPARSSSRLLLSSASPIGPGQATSHEALQDARLLLQTTNNSSATPLGCIDAQTGVPVSCQQQQLPTLILIVGITCMLCLILLGLTLLTYSWCNRPARQSNPGSGESVISSNTTSAAATCATASSCTDEMVIMVRLAGDEEAKFVALPAPLKTSATTALADADASSQPPLDVESKAAAAAAASTAHEEEGEDSSVVR
ncbi:hypothetical protein BDL97_12G083500 [Sphagnum fallax]|nr:hypothetical protein BDL97_12G083500 [Sphagnum fallax]